MQTFDRNDRSYIIRFKMFMSTKDMDIKITYKGKNVGDSPYSLKGKPVLQNCMIMS